MYCVSVSSVSPLQFDSIINCVQMCEHFQVVEIDGGFVLFFSQPQPQPLSLTPTIILLYWQCGCW